MVKMKRTLTELLNIAVGIIFLLSGISKAFDTESFAYIIYSYGFHSLQFLSPIIVLIETFIGLLLIFDIRVKAVSIFCLIMVLSFTGVYIYGLAFHNIENCGCFGNIRFLSSNPFAVLIRNAVLMFFLVLIYLHSNNSGKFNTYSYTATIIAICSVAYMSGYSYNIVDNNYNKTSISIDVSDLKNYVSISPDSTYVIFAFTYSCPHCMNSIANLNNYVHSDGIDKVIGIAKENPYELENFINDFNPKFEIKIFKNGIQSLTRDYPKTWVVKNNTIIAEISGELPCIQVLVKTLILY